MGYINIEIGGSFGNTKPHSRETRQFSALELGHAAALAEAIEYLAGLLPRAIDLDHRLHATHSMPSGGFGLSWSEAQRASVARTPPGEDARP